MKPLFKGTIFLFPFVMTPLVCAYIAYTILHGIFSGVLLFILFTDKSWQIPLSSPLYLPTSKECSISRTNGQASSEASVFKKEINEIHVCRPSKEEGI